MNEPVEFLDLDDVIVWPLRSSVIRHQFAISACSVRLWRATNTAFGDDAYPDIWTKAAALLQSIVTNHALVDGNKRLGWLSTGVFLEINGIEISRAQQ